MKQLVILGMFSVALIWMGSPEHAARAAGSSVQRRGRDNLVQDFAWRGRLAPGQMLELKGINGDIRAELSDGDEVTVVARKHGRWDAEESVRIEVVEHEGGVTICTIYENRGRRPNVCAPGDAGRLNSRNNDVEVDFVASIPAGVNFTGRTVNGDVEVLSLEGNVFGYTVNGDVAITATGVAGAATVNGSIDVRMGRADWDGDMDFRTVNGGITLRVPSDFAAEITGETLNGSIESDFPIMIRGRFGPRRLSGTIGGGGRGLHVETVNGSIRLLSNG